MDMLEVVMKYLEDGYFIDSVVTSCPDVDSLIDRFLAEGDDVGLLGFVRDNFDVYMAVEQFVLRKRGVDGYLVVDRDGNAYFVRE